ncbi:MAG TPA: phosphate ABC transporter substrate-binding protein [Candidatus Cloacimonas sp.]|nr:phosphate transport system substrate-binding protein [Candidatus Cloacimonadota bacterium]HCX73727.1 phosphate ABC transporter substrate-binding protein [Candidatus Cloacimonas sp.]
MKFKILAILTVLAVLAVPAFAQDNRLTVAGSTTVLPIAQAAAEAYMDMHPEINISVRGGGSSVGIASIIAGTADIGNASRHAKTKELATARENGINLYENVVANDGIAVVVNPSNSINGLTTAQLKSIYAGEVQNWKELGGPNKPIVIISRDTSSGTFEVFNNLVMSDSPVAAGALKLASNNAVATTVSNTPGAIGYVGLGYLNASIKAITIDNVMPTKKTIQNKEYPIARTLHMYTNGKPTGLAKKFIDFIVSAKGQEIVEGQGFVSIN